MEHLESLKTSWEMVHLPCPRLGLSTPGVGCDSSVGGMQGLVCLCEVSWVKCVLWTKCGPLEERAGCGQLVSCLTGPPRGADRPQQQEAGGGHWIAEVLERNPKGPPGIKMYLPVPREPQER